MRQKAEIPYLIGDSKLVYEPAPHGTDDRWFINDHCFVVDVDGILHFCGIINCGNYDRALNRFSQEINKDLRKHHTSLLPFIYRVFCDSVQCKKWSGRGDLNPRPLGPEPSAKNQYLLMISSKHAKIILNKCHVW